MRLVIVIAVLFASAITAHKYEPNWASLDSRPLPLWYDEVKFGIFSHWGVYSVPAYHSEWLWYYWRTKKNSDVVNYLDKHFHGQSYADFATQFTAEDLDPAEFAEIVAASGAKYFVLTSKHHEGFTLWPSDTSFNWNAVDVGPKKDLVGTLKAAFKKTDVHFGLYFSQLDWYHPLYLSDGLNNKTEFVKQVSYPQMLELVTKYEPDVIWSDGEWERTDEYWNAKNFLTWLYNESPIKDKIVVNDRWGNNTLGKHGGFLTYSDHYDPGQLLPRKWENCMTLDKNSWGYRRNMKASDIHTVKEILAQLVRTISCNGNLLLNVGPDRFGRIAPIFEERLRSIGNFLRPNAPAVYGTKPWIHQHDGSVWYTSSLRNDTGFDPRRVFNPQNEKNTIIYAWIFDLPYDNNVTLSYVKRTDFTRATILGTNIKLTHSAAPKGITINLNNLPFQKLPSTDAIILKIEYAGSSHFNPLKKAHHIKKVSEKNVAEMLKELLRNNRYNNKN